MTKNEKLQSAKKLVALAINALKEIKLTNEEELSALYFALNVSNYEQIEDSKMYCLAADTEFKSEQLKSIIEDLESHAKDLYSLYL